MPIMTIAMRIFAVFLMILCIATLYENFRTGAHIFGVAIALIIMAPSAILGWLAAGRLEKIEKRR